MLYETIPYVYTTSGASGFVNSDVQSKQETSEKPPRKPDWLLILMGVFVLITLLIVLFLNNDRF